MPEYSPVRNVRVGDAQELQGSDGGAVTILPPLAVDIVASEIRELLASQGVLLLSGLPANAASTVAGMLEALPNKPAFDSDDYETKVILGAEGAAKASAVAVAYASFAAQSQGLDPNSEEYDELKCKLMPLEAPVSDLLAPEDVTGLLSSEEVANDEP